MISGIHRTLVLLALTMLGMGCGGAATAPDPGPDAGVDPSQHLSELTPSDTTALCDWLAGRLGGYGHQRVCGTLTLSAYDNRTACMMAFQAASVVCLAGDLETCVNFVVTGPCPIGAAPAACANILSCSGA